MELVIGTSYGDTYHVDMKGRVIQFSNGLNKRNASDRDKNKWTITGAWFYKGVTQYINFKELVEIANLPFIVKNKKLKLVDGTPRYGLTDLDHGTNRKHGNKRVHGISSLEIREVKNHIK